MFTSVFYLFVIYSGYYPVFKTGVASLGNQLVQVEIAKCRAELSELQSKVDQLHAVLEILVSELYHSDL